MGCWGSGGLGCLGFGCLGVVGRIGSLGLTSSVGFGFWSSGFGCEFTVWSGLRCGFRIGFYPAPSTPTLPTPKASKPPSRALNPPQTPPPPPRACAPEQPPPPETPQNTPNTPPSSPKARLCSASAPRTSRRYRSARLSPLRATADCRRSRGWWGTASAQDEGGPGAGRRARTTLRTVFGGFWVGFGPVWTVSNRVQAGLGRFVAQQGGGFGAARQSVRLAGVGLRRGAPPNDSTARAEGAPNRAPRPPVARRVQVGFEVEEVPLVGDLSGGV